MPAILFVCTANICRSPMAMALFREKVDNDPQEWRVESAGTWAPEGIPASTNSQQVLHEYNLDISNHFSRPIEHIALDEFDLILVMEKGHKEALRVEYPEISDRVFLLYEMIGHKRDVHDPYGSRPIDYADTAQEIDQILNDGMEKIVQIAKKNENKRNKKK